MVSITGELISVGLYYKNIDDHVELYRRITPDAANVFTRLNTKNAKVKGVEVDIQKILVLFLRALEI